MEQSLDHLQPSDQVHETCLLFIDAFIKLGTCALLTHTFAADQRDAELAAWPHQQLRLSHVPEQPRRPLLQRSHPVSSLPGLCWLHLLFGVNVLIYQMINLNVVFRS